MAVVNHFSLGLPQQILNILRLNLILIKLVLCRHRLLGADVVQGFVGMGVRQLVQLLDFDVDVFDVHFRVWVLDAALNGVAG